MGLKTTKHLIQRATTDLKQEVNTQVLAFLHLYPSIMKKKPELTDEQKKARLEAVYKEYRAGIKSNYQIADENDITETLIRKWAKNYGWEKDLAGAIKAKAAALVREQAIRNEVRAEVGEQEDAQIVEENAQIQATVIREHRKDIGKARNIAKLLFDELEVAVLNPQELEEFAEIRATLETQDDANSARKDNLLRIYTKIMELPNKAGVMEKLANTLGKLITLEREAFNIETSVDEKSTVEEFLARLDA